MQKSLLTGLGMLLLFSQAAAAPLLTPSTPQGVVSGGSVHFTASGFGTGLNCSVTGVGTCSVAGTTVTYNAPASVTVQNQSRGCQELPNNSPFNIPVDTLPVDSHSARWLTRVSEDGPQYADYHNLKLFPELIGFYDNVVDNSTPTQVMNFYYGGAFQGAMFPIPPEKTFLMESGRLTDAADGYDHHWFSINKTTCQEDEAYSLYFDFQTSSFTPGNPTAVSWTTHTIWPMPQNYQVYVYGGTGTWAALNGNSYRVTVTGAHSGTIPVNSSTWGSPNSGLVLSSTPSSDSCTPPGGCNAAGGQKYLPTSYAQMGGVDAAGMPMSAASVKDQEWIAAVKAGRSDLGHAIRETLGNNYLSTRQIWPATSEAYAVAGFQNSITACTNANPVECTTLSDLSQSLPCANYTYAPGCIFYINISNLTGSWAPLNGDQTATAVDNTHFTVAAVNSTSWGALTGHGPYLVDDFFPYGATLRLKASFNVANFCANTTSGCAAAKVLLNTLQKYGMVIADGTIPSDNWDMGVVSNEYRDDTLRDAAALIEGSSALQNIENELEVVDRSSQIGPQGGDINNLGMWQQSNVNRTYLTVTGSNGSASVDIIPQGTTIGTDQERLTIAGGTAYQLNVWVNGNVNTSLNYVIDSGITGASVSSTGLLSMPNCVMQQWGTVTVTSAVDSQALPLYISVTCVPVSGDGSIRLAFGNYSGNYTDASGFTWWGAWNTTGPNHGFSNWYQTAGALVGSQLGSWQGLGPCSNDTWSGTDSQLYSRSMNSDGTDLPLEVILPNGSYVVTLYGEPGFGGFGNDDTCGNTAGKNLFDLEVQGTDLLGWQDGYVLAGNQPYHGWTLTEPATVTDNTLGVVGRNRNGLSIYGIAWSSLLITPSADIHLTVTTASLPDGMVGIAYNQTLQAFGGTSPYTWSLVSGSLPSGLNLDAGTGAITGTPTSAGTSNFTVQVTDAGADAASAALGITIQESQTSFMFSPSSPVMGQAVQFTDTSINHPTGWSWNFGDSASSDNTSTQQNPTHTYASAGSYTVTLTVTTGSIGGGDVAIQTVTVSSGAGSGAKSGGGALDWFSLVMLLGFIGYVRWRLKPVSS